LGVLYLVATPIGNLEDITFRAVRVLQEVSTIAAEDTRTTKKLLQRHKIKTPLVSYYEGNRAKRIPFLLEKLSRGDDVALVSEAGTPIIRDPGQELVQAAVQNGVKVVPIPGPSAVTTALAVSGMSSGEFYFLGFLPSRRKERVQVLERAASSPHTLVIFEAPHRLQASLRDMARVLGSDRAVAVCRELTKMYEEVFRGTIEEASAHFTQPRGEFTLVIAGSGDAAPSKDVDEARLIQELRALEQAETPAKEAVPRVAREHNLPRRLVYRLWLESKR